MSSNESNDSENAETVSSTEKKIKNGSRSKDGKRKKKHKNKSKNKSKTKSKKNSRKSSKRQKKARKKGHVPDSSMLLEDSDDDLEDITDYGIVKDKLQEIQKEKNINKNDYNNLEKLIIDIEKMNKLFKKDWMKYTWLTKKSYDKKWKID